MKRWKNHRMAEKLLIFICLVFILCMHDTEITYADKKNSQVDTTNISIDGYYDDWEDKPISEIFWNNGHRNDVSFIKNENYVYIYIKMHPSYHSPMPIDSINLSVNNATCQLFVRYANNQNRVDWGHQVNLSKDQIYLNLHPFTYYPDYSLGDAAITVSNGNPNDRMEIRISIKQLEQVMKLEDGTINKGSKLTLSMPNVGGGTIEVVGTPTGTILGFILCSGVVLAVKRYRGKKVRLVH